MRMLPEFLRHMAFIFAAPGAILLAAAVFTPRDPDLPVNLGQLAGGLLVAAGVLLVASAFVPRRGR